MVERILWLLVGLSCLYWIGVWWGVRCFLLRESALEIHESPPVSILKPVKGLDDDAYENFASFCRQQYPEYELLFGIADPEDPAADVVSRLQQEFTNLRIRLLVVPETTMNPKSSILEELARHVRHDVLVVADSDIRVAPDYLRRVIAPLHDPQIGLVTCPYRTVHPRTWAALAESLYFNTTFLPSAIAANTLLGTCVSFGATMALRRDDLQRIGGFRAIGEYLSDDYHVARRIERLGKHVFLSDYFVANVIGRADFRQQWNREVRLARGIRRLCPYQYPGLLLTHPLPLALVLVLVSGLSMATGLAVGISLLVRWSFAAWVLRRFDRTQLSSLPWLPLRDGLSASVLCCAAFGRHVTWRGRDFVLCADGRLQPGNDGVRVGLRSLICGLDRWLRQYYGISEFSERSDCLLRLSISSSDRTLHLSDGTQVKSGDTIGELHLWNEHLSGIGSGTNLGWGRAFQKQMRDSLRELARHVQTRPELNSIQVFRADLPYNGHNAARSLARLADYFGIDILERPRPSGVLGQFHAWGDQLLRWALIWTFNPRGLRAEQLCRQRWYVWLSRETLMKKFGAVSPRATSGPLESDRHRHDRIGAPSTVEQKLPSGVNSAPLRWSLQKESSTRTTRNDSLR